MNCSEFQEAVRRSVPLADIASDYTSSSLYLRITDTTSALVREYDFRNMVSTFRNRVEGGAWYDVPFAKLPEMRDAIWNP